MQVTSRGCHSSQIKASYRISPAAVSHLGFGVITAPGRPVAITISYTVVHGTCKWKKHRQQEREAADHPSPFLAVNLDPFILSLKNNGVRKPIGSTR